MNQYLIKKGRTLKVENLKYAVITVIILFCCVLLCEDLKKGIVNAFGLILVFHQL